MPTYSFERQSYWLGGLRKSKQIQDETLQIEKTAKPAAPKYPRYENTEIESMLMSLVRQYFDNQNIQVQDNLFHLGMDSIAVLEMAETIKNLFGVVMSINDFHTYPTIKLLSNRLREEKLMLKKDPIFIIRENKKEIPLVLVHPIGGTIFPYIYMSQYLDKKLPFFTIQDSFHSNASSLFDSLSDLSSYYNKYLLEKLDGRQCYLGGWSFGGVVALEMSRQLKESDTSIIKKLVLIDSHPWDAVKDSLSSESIVQEIFDRQNSITEASSSSTLSLIKEKINSHMRLYTNYQPRLYDEDVLLFKATVPVNGEKIMTRYPDNGWKNFDSTKFKICEIDTNHYDLFTDPWVEKLAKKINEEIL
jgi:thioesterase domain-containing protein/acyl carrier protein